MKTFTTLESTVISFFVSLVVSTYLVALLAAGGVMGPVLKSVSLSFLLANIVSNGNYFTIAFLFYLVVFMVYGLIFAIVNNLIPGTKFVAMAAVVVLMAVIFFQQRRLPDQAVSAPDLVANRSSVKLERKEPKTKERYFGREAWGDLDGDKKDDVAFLVSRDDDKYGSAYYLAAALTSSDGHKGTSLLFLGQTTDPKSISIQNQVIVVDYVSRVQPKNKGQFLARVVADKLKQVDKK